MKRKLFIIFILLNAILNAGIFKIEKIDGEKPWWTKNYVIEGLHSSIGEVDKTLGKTNNAIREEAISSAKAELAGNKSTTIKTEIKTVKTNTESQTAVGSVQTVDTKLKVEIIDSWENDKKYYVWVVEKTDNWENDKKIIKNMIEKNNKKTKIRREKILKENEKNKESKKYDNRIIEKHFNRVLINIGQGEAKLGEIANIYDYSLKKVGEMEIVELFKNESLGKVSLWSSFKIKEGYGVKLTGLSKRKKYIPIDNTYKVFSENIEQAKVIRNRNYLLKIDRNFAENINNMDFKYGLFDFFELLLKYDERDFNYGIKLGLDFKKINIGGIYFVKDKSFDILLDSKFIMGMNSHLNYKKTDSDKIIVLGLSKNIERITIYGDAKYDMNKNKIDEELIKLTLNIVKDKKLYLDLGMKRDEDLKDSSFFMGISKIGTF
ncbi:hypothetical protein [Haliovirga abyssi]|uniref:Uncharacterized protein n=1 Tax=Haliovirga abyssi TaxID=2996794 RepID=A0AAU9D8V9_9FUSO|nr:hypothetical protein [Haliovirga abyssi]BDU51048.1 hypothetical protein HLVA_16170 [Haliovirga abyssi]